MEPTQIKPASVPVHAGPSTPEPFQRAPTLMAGATAGSQGEVRVWGPRKRDLWLAVTLYPLTLAIIGYSVGILIHFPLIIFNVLAAGSLGIFAAMKTLYRPCYVTTDDAGIGTTTWKVSRALRWEEIQSAKALFLAQPGRITLGLETEDDVEINLTGYPAPMQNELFSLILARSGLCEHPLTKHLYVREEAVPLRMRAFCISGVMVGRNTQDRLVVEAVAPSSLAQKAGIEPGDEVLAVDGQCVDALSGEEVALALLRPAGEMITLRLRRPAQETIHEYRIRTLGFSEWPALSTA